MGRPEDFYPVRHPHRREIRREGAGFHALEERRGQVFHAQGVPRKGKENQTDKNKTVVLLYVDDPVEKHTFLEAARGKGYDVLLMDGQLDNHYVNWYESKNKETRSCAWTAT